MPGHNRSHRGTISILYLNRLACSQLLGRLLTPRSPYPLASRTQFCRRRRRHRSTPSASPADDADLSSGRRSSPTYNPTLSHWYSNMPVCDAPCPPPTPPAISQSPPSPTHPATIQPGSVPLASGVDAAAAVAEAAFTLKVPDVAEANAAAVGHAAYAAAVAIDGVRGGADQRRFPSGVARVRRRRLQPDRLPLAPRAQRRTLTLGVRLDVIEARERGLSFPDILRTIDPSSSIDNLRKVWQRLNHYTFPHDTSGCATSANTVRGCSGSIVGPSGAFSYLRLRSCDTHSETRFEFVAASLW